MCTLPTNVIRPTNADWTPAWGDMEIPDSTGGDALELAHLLPLKGLGANIRRLPPGKTGGPMHYHMFEEELFYLMEGELTVREWLPDASDATEYTQQAGELVVYPPGTRVAHKTFNRSDQTAVVLSLSSEWNLHEVCEYPDSGKTQVRGMGILGTFEDQPLEKAAQAATQRGVRSLSRDQRPSWIVGPDGPERELGNGVFGRPLARKAGATEVYLNVDRLEAGAVSSPLHWHTRDSELVVVLDGMPTLRQMHDGEEQQTQLQAGDVVCWSPGDKVAHQLLANDGPTTLIVVGTHRPDDVTVLVEEDQIFVRALGRKGRLTRRGYWDGEP